MVSGEWRTTHYSLLTIRYFLCGGEPSKPAQADGAEQAVAGSIAARAGAAREPRRGATAGEQIGDGLAVRPQHAAVVIDHQPALGVEQARHDAADVERAD